MTTLAHLKSLKQFVDDMDAKFVYFNSGDIGLKLSKESKPTLKIHDRFYDNINEDFKIMLIENGSRDVTGIRIYHHVTGNKAVEMINTSQVILY